MSREKDDPADGRIRAEDVIAHIESLKLAEVGDLIAQLRPSSRPCRR